MKWVKHWQMIRDIMTRADSGKEYQCPKSLHFLNNPRLNVNLPVLNRRSLKQLENYQVALMSRFLMLENLACLINNR